MKVNYYGKFHVAYPCRILKSCFGKRYQSKRFRTVICYICIRVFTLKYKVSKRSVCGVSAVCSVQGARIITSVVVSVPRYVTRPLN